MSDKQEAVAAAPAPAPEAAAPELTAHQKEVAWLTARERLALARLAPAAPELTAHQKKEVAALSELHDLHRAAHGGEVKAVKQTDPTKPAAFVVVIVLLFLSMVGRLEAQSNLFANGTSGNAPFISTSNYYGVNAQQILQGDLLLPSPKSGSGGTTPGQSVNNYSTNGINIVTGVSVPSFGNPWSSYMVLSMSWQVTNTDTFVTNGGGTVQAVFDASTGFGDWTNGWYTLSGTITNSYGGSTNGIGQVTVSANVTNGAYTVFRLHSIYQTNCDYGLTNVNVQYSAPIHKSNI
jgi:hypothetical protein